jgi:hypothetical protein
MSQPPPHSHAQVLGFTTCGAAQLFGQAHSHVAGSTTCNPEQVTGGQPHVQVLGSRTLGPWHVRVQTHWQVVGSWTVSGPHVMAGQLHPHVVGSWCVGGAGQPLGHPPQAQVVGSRTRGLTQEGTHAPLQQVVPAGQPPPLPLPLHGDAQVPLTHFSPGQHFPLGAHGPPGVHEAPPLAALARTRFLSWPFLSLFFLASTSCMPTTAASPPRRRAST